MIRLSVALFLVQAGFHGFTVSIPLAMARSGRPDADIGAIVGIAALVQIGAALAGGALIDRFGAIRLFVAGGLCYLAATLILLVSGIGPDATPAVVVARVLQGAGFGLVVPSVLSVVPSLVPAARRGMAIATAGSAHNITFVALPPISLVVLNEFGLPGVTVMVAVLVVAALMLALARPITLRAQAETHLEAAQRRFGFAWRPAWFMPLAIVILFVLHWGVLSAYLPQRAEAARADISLFFAADGLFVLLARIPAGWIADRVPQLWPVLAGIAMTFGAVALLFDTPTTPVLVLSGSLTGVGAALIVQPLMLALTARSGDADRGSAFALFSATFSAGLALGTIGTAPLIGTLGYGTLLAIALGALGASGVVAFLDRGLRSPVNGRRAQVEVPEAVQGGGHTHRALNSIIPADGYSGFPMKIGVVRERAPNERRVALVPDALKALTGAGVEVLVERGAGDSAALPDELFAAAGAKVVDRAELYRDADVIVRVQKPAGDDVTSLRKGQAVVGLLQPLLDPKLMSTLATQGVTAISLDAIPRTLSRAQPMDVLSSQANVGGYRAVLMAAEAYGRYFPLLTTAAGTARPANVLILGIGVAGLQAIATARRLGAVVKAYDVRSETKEQAESLGAQFIVLKSVADASGAGGYARELTPEERAAQQQELNGHIANMDVVITTAQVPGRRPPVLVTADAVKGMKPGSVIVDMAASALGGNVELSKADERVISDNGVIILAPSNLPATMPAGASQFYARNVSTFLVHFLKDGALIIDPSDEITAATLITHDGAVVQAATKALLDKEAAS